MHGDVLGEIGVAALQFHQDADAGSMQISAQNATGVANRRSGER